MPADIWWRCLFGDPSQSSFSTIGRKRRQEKRPLGQQKGTWILLTFIRLFLKEGKIKLFPLETITVWFILNLKILPTLLYNISRRFSSDRTNRGRSYISIEMNKDQQDYTNSIPDKREIWQILKEMKRDASPDLMD